MKSICLNEIVHSVWLNNPYRLNSSVWILFSCSAPYHSTFHTLDFVFHVLHVIYSTLYILYWMFHIPYSILHISYPIIFTQYSTSHNLISVILYPLSYTLYPTFYFHIKSLFYTFHSLYSMLHRDNLWVSMNFVIPQVEFHSPQSPMISHRANFRAPLKIFILQKKWISSI